MRAVGLDEFGGPDVLHVVELAMPQPQANEVRVRVAAATVNPTDILFRSGRQRARMGDMPAPYVPGMEFAGVVDAVGSGVRFTPGTRVMGIMQPRQFRGGAQAEFVIAAASSVVSVPDDVRFEHAATVPMNGLTALIAVETVALSAGQTLLITGAAGAVGGYCVQMAHALGLVVMADALEQDVALIRRLGADEILERGSQLARAVLKLRPDGVDGLIDAALMGSGIYPAVRTGGTVAALRAGNEDPSGRVQVRDVWVTGQAHNTDALQRLAAMMGDGTITARVAQCIPMEEASRAHAMLEAGGLRGRLVLTF
jgi:NADPH2:quinone reductase